MAKQKPRIIGFDQLGAVVFKAHEKDADRAQVETAEALTGNHEESGARAELLSDALNQGLAALRDNDDLWNAGIESSDREAMIHAAVLNSGNFSKAEIEEELSVKGRRIFFDETAKLLPLSEELNLLQAEASAPSIEVASKPIKKGRGARRKAELKARSAVKDSVPLPESVETPSIEPIAGALSEVLTEQRQHDAKRAKDKKLAREAALREMAEAEHRIRILPVMAEVEQPPEIAPPMLLDEPVVENAPVVKAENGRGFALQQQLDDIVLKIAGARELLRADQPDVRTLNDALITASSEINSLLAEISIEKTRDQDVDVLERQALFALNDLVRLQDRAKVVVGEMKNFEVGHEAPMYEIANEMPEEEVMVKRGKSKAKRKTRKPVAEVVAEISPADEIINPVTPEAKGVFAKARETLGHTLSYVLHGWDRVKREELRGELSPQELGEVKGMTREEFVLRASAGLFGGLASSAGVEIVPDLVRYVAQSRYTAQEKSELNAAIQEAAKIRTVAETLPEAESQALEIVERQNKLVARINKSRYLLPEAKAALLQRIERVASANIVATAEAQTVWKQELGEIIDTHVQTKITGGKIAKELVNSATMLSSVAALATGYGAAYAGLNFLRGPAYAAQNFILEKRQANREKALGERTDARAVTVMKEGFTKWWLALNRESDKTQFGKSVDQLRAFATLSRALGFAGVGATAAGILETKMADNVSDLLAHALEKVHDYGTHLHDQLFASEALAAPDMTQHFGSAIEAPSVPVASAEVFRGEIPVGSRVEKILESGNALVASEEGITYPLRRVIEANPEAYGFDSVKNPEGAKMFAKLLAMQIAKRDTGMTTWLTHKAVGKLNMFPELRDGEWHVAAVVGGKKLSLEQLAEQGFTTPAPGSK